VTPVRPFHVVRRTIGGVADFDIRQVTVHGVGLVWPGGTRHRNDRDGRFVNRQ
jgi:hypothetical protein